MASNPAFAAFASTALTLSPRARGILERFPAHLEAPSGGKLLGHVVEGLADEIEGLVAGLAGIRRAHRLGEADKLRDLLLLGALHGITSAELAVALLRFGRARTALAALEEALGTPAEADA